MTDVELSSNALHVNVIGVDKILALRSHLEIPLTNVLGAAPLDAQTKADLRGSLRVPGTYVPGVIIAGSYYQWGKKEWMFWDVAHPENAIVISLDHEKFTRLVIEVADPTATIASIESALRSGRARL